MSEQLWAKVAERLNDHGYMAGIERTLARVRKTGEIFTPSALVIEMLRELSPEALAPGKTVFDPACGDGQFLVAAKWVKVYFHGMTEHDATLEIFGVDLMRDNIEICRRRLGGGTIIQGDTLRPERHIEGQTEHDRAMMLALFSGSV